MRYVLAIALLFAVDDRPQQQRDAASELTKGNSSISGSVIDSGQAPLHGVVVTLKGPYLGAGRLAVTDADGKFAFPELPSGNFTIEAACPGFVRAFYGSALPGRGPGIAIAVRSGQSVENVILRMIRGGVISGIVRDAYARPQPNAEVSLIPVTSKGLPEFDRVVVFATDDAGHYRAYGLRPGKYFVAVQPGFNYNGATQHSRQHLDELMSGRTPTRATGVETTVRSGYAPVYFPGSASVRGAATLELNPGEELSGIDISFQFVRMTRLEGRLTVPSGMVLKDIDLRIAPQDPSDLELRSYAGTRPGVGSVIRMTGSEFQRTGLAPGRYTLRAVATAVGPSGPTSLWGRAEVDAAGQEVISVTLTLQAPVTVVGTALSVPRAPVEGGRILLRSAEDRSANARVTSIDANGGFAFRDVVPGRYSIDMELAGESGWRLVDATVGSVSVLDQPLILTAGQDLKGLRATISNQPSLRGRLVDSGGRVTSGYVIVVFSSDRQHWDDGRRVVVARPASNGQYTVPALPAGEYLICAAPDADLVDLRDPAYLEIASRTAIKVTVGLGTVQELDLQIPSTIRFF